MEASGTGKSPNTSLSFRYIANNEEIEELFNACEDDPPTPQCDPPSTAQSENASPKRGDRTPSIIDKYFKSMRSEKPVDKDKDKLEETKPAEVKDKDDSRSSTPKEITSSPMKEYLNRLGKRSTQEVNQDVKEGSNETWKIFHDFKFKIAQAVEDMKTKSLEDTKDEKKSLPRDNSTSDSEENSVAKDIDQQSVGDTDNQVSSLGSSMQNLSELTQPITAKATERDFSLPVEKSHSDSSDDTHKNLTYSEIADLKDDFLTDSLLDVESGIEALEDTMDGFGDINNVPADPLYQDNKPKLSESTPNNPPRTPTKNFGLPPPSRPNLQKNKVPLSKKYFLNFTMYFLTIFLIVNYLLFPKSNVWNGFLLGIWSFCLLSDTKHWLLDNYFSHWEPQTGGFFRAKRNSAITAAYTIPSVKEHRPLKKYEGWINHYRIPDYDPYTYHINKTTTAFMKLEGCNLRISYTRTKVAKRALWDEKLDKVTFYQHRLYNLTGARVILLPKGLVKRRQWSKKYPICVILNEKEKIQVLEKENVSHTERKVSEVVVEKKKGQQPETESAETNTSPEKKKKFVWRRREKSVSHADGEAGREGLRHRLVRKMHRDKKTDSVSTCTEPTVEPQGQDDKRTDKNDELLDDMELASKSVTSTKEEDEELDDTEMSRIKDFLEEADLETGADSTAEGEWSVHVKQSKDKHSHLYLFARTGRDKHEWFRRLTTAALEANAGSTESSASEDRSGAETPGDRDQSIELAVYKLTEKDTVAFAKNTSKTLDSTISEGVTITSLSQPLPNDTESYEKNFWPYLFKIIQTHEITFKKLTEEVAVMCQIEPSPHERSKRKKKRKCDSKSSSPECDCRLLPAEVTWVNTALARLMYDVTRDPVILARVQHRIQRKLNTLKLPSFMSPLVVTELSLSGACPLVERVLPVSYDARGVWLDADLRYDGGAYIALSTQINLMKLKEKNITLEDQLLVTSESTVENEGNGSPVAASLFGERMSVKKKPAIYDSEIEDSAESSSDDESPPVQPIDSSEDIPQPDPVPTSTEGGSSKKKFLRMVDKIATNKYFQQVTDYKYVKRAMEGLSNTDIKLHLEIHGLEGRLALNLPPPPHDRVWIGFRTNPQLVLKARPAVGARTLRFAHVSNWIEQKLSKEFEKVLVLPNMEDIIVDLMTPTPVHFE